MSGLLVMMSNVPRATPPPRFDPVPEGAVEEPPADPSPTYTTSAYAPGMSNAFDGDENTFVRMYTYAAGSTSANLDPPSTVVAVEAVVGPTRGYSGEVGWFGGPVSIRITSDEHGEVEYLSIESGTDPNVHPVGRASFDPITATQVRVVKAAGSRFLVYEVRLYGV